MELNNTQRIALEVSKIIESIFENRVSSSKIYDVADDAGYHSFKIGFIAYNYFPVIFQYEQDIIGCYIECGKNSCISLITDKCCYSDTDIHKYLSKAKNELELRIPDKYLKSKGWMCSVVNDS